MEALKHSPNIDVHSEDNQEKPIILSRPPRVHLNKNVMPARSGGYPRISLNLNLQEAKRQQEMKPPRIHLNSKDIFVAHGKIPRVHLNPTQKAA
jgi:hypothetical protein